MFYNNPMFSSYPPNFNPGFKKPGINWGGFLNTTQKTLNVVNQAIPVFYQIKPLWSNAKTIFKVFGEFNKINNPTTNPSLRTNTGSNQEINKTYNDGPNFFI